MDRVSLEKRLRELSIYSTFYLRRELKPLAQLLQEAEQLNCIITGVHEGNRKLVAVTDRRIIILFAGALGSGEVKVIRRSAVRDPWFEKKLFFSEAGFATDSEVFTFTNTQGSLRELYEWAMGRPIPDGA